MKKLLLLVFCILLLVPLALAAKPAQVFTGGDGLDIRIPPAEFIKQDSDGQLNIHVFNKSNGIPIDNLSTDCFVHIFNSSGNHQAVEKMDYGEDSGDFDIEFDGNNFTVPGFYSFIIQCNDSRFGGFVSGSIRATPDGQDDTKTDTSPGISATIFILFIVTLLFVMPFVKQFSKFEWANNIFKRAFWTVGVFVLMWNSSILSTIADNANLDIVSHLFRYMIMFGWAGYILAGYMVLKSLFEMLGAWRVSKEKKRSGEDEDGE